MRYHKQTDAHYHSSKQAVIDVILNTNYFKPFKDDQKLFRKTQIHIHKTKTEYWDKKERNKGSQKGVSGVTGVTKSNTGGWVSTYRFNNGELKHLGIFLKKDLLKAIWCRYEAELIYGCTEQSNSLAKLIELGEVIK